MYFVIQTLELRLPLVRNSKQFDLLTLDPSRQTGEATLLENSGRVTKFNGSSLAPCKIQQERKEITT